MDADAFWRIIVDEPLGEDETEEEIRADEALWDKQFAETQDDLKRMADAIMIEGLQVGAYKEFSI